MKITFRWIEGPTASQEDWDRIEAILAARGWVALNRPTSRIRVAENEDGNLLGLYVLQMTPHAEPLWVTPSQRGTGLADQLADDMLAFLTEVKARGWMVVADNSATAKMCERRGMVKLESPVYITKVGW